MDALCGKNRSVGWVTVTSDVSADGELACAVEQQEWVVPFVDGFRRRPHWQVRVSRSMSEELLVATIKDSTADVRDQLKDFGIHTEWGRDGGGVGRWLPSV